MAIEVKCDHCGRLLKSRDEAAGRTGKCPGCGARIAIPAMSGAREPQIDEAELMLPPPELPLAPPPLPPASVQESPRRPCPKCGESIAVGAAKCRFCGTIFDKRITKHRGKERSGDASLGVAEWLLAILCSGIGCIFGIIWTIRGEPKGPKMILVSLLFAILWGLIRVAIDPP